MHVAELNIGRLNYPIDDPRMADFVDNLDARQRDGRPHAGLRLAPRSATAATAARSSCDPIPIR